MRELIIKRLSLVIADSDGEGIPLYYDCDDDEFITDPLDLDKLSDEALLDVYDATIGFMG